MNESLGKKQERLFAVRAEKAAIEERAKELEKEAKGLKIEIRSEMELLGIDKMTTDSGTLSAKDEVHPQVEDWDKFLDWVGADPGRRVYLFRRVNGGPFRELLVSTGELPPGLESYVDRGLNVRSKGE